MVKKKVLKIYIELSIIVFIIVSFILINVFIVENQKISFTLDSDSNEYAYQTESVKLENDKVVIKGWFFELNKVQNVEHKKDDIDGEIGIVLFDLENNEFDHDKEKKGIKAEVINQKRLDVDAYFKCEYDYSNCGFVASIDKEKIDFENGKYQIILKKKEKSPNGISIGYIYKGKLMHINPIDVWEIDTNGTDLKEIVRSGDLLVSNSELHFSIYQYHWKLYWITDNDFFTQRHNSYFSCIVDTTQFEKLPQNMRERFYLDLGTSYEAYEKTEEMECGEYRISVRDLPIECSITSITLGNYMDGSWLWKSILRPIYDFDLLH